MFTFLEFIFELRRLRVYTLDLMANQNTVRHEEIDDLFDQLDFILLQIELDMTYIQSLIINDPHRRSDYKELKLQSLIDYIEILIAIFDKA